MRGLAFATLLACWAEPVWSSVRGCRSGAVVTPNDIVQGRPRSAVAAPTVYSIVQGRPRRGRAAAAALAVRGGGDDSLCYTAWEWMANLGAPAALVGGAALASFYELRPALEPHPGDKRGMRAAKKAVFFLLLSAFASEISSVFVTTVTGTLLLGQGDAKGFAKGKQTIASCALAAGVPGQPYASAMGMLHRELEFESLASRVGFFHGIISWLAAISIQLAIPDPADCDNGNSNNKAALPGAAPSPSRHLALAASAAVASLAMWMCARHIYINRHRGGGRGAARRCALMGRGGCHVARAEAAWPAVRREAAGRLRRAPGSEARRRGGCAEPEDHAREGWTRAAPRQPQRRVVASCGGRRSSSSSQRPQNTTDPTPAPQVRILQQAPLVLQQLRAHVHEARPPRGPSVPRPSVPRPRSAPARARARRRSIERPRVPLAHHYPSVPLVHLVPGPTPRRIEPPCVPRAPPPLVSPLDHLAPPMPRASSRPATTPATRARAAAMLSLARTEVERYLLVWPPRILPLITLVPSGYAVYHLYQAFIHDARD